MIQTENGAFLVSEVERIAFIQAFTERPEVVVSDDTYIAFEQPEIAPVVIEYVQNVSVIVQNDSRDQLTLEAVGPQGIPGPPGPGVARYIKTLSGFLTVIPQAEHGLTAPAFCSVRRPGGREVSLVTEIAGDGSVTVESLIPMDGLILTLE